MNNDYKRSDLPPIEDYKQRGPLPNDNHTPELRNWLPMGKILSFGAAATISIVPAYEFSRAEEDQATIVRKLSDIEMCEQTIADNIRDFNRVMTAIVVNNNDLLRQDLLDQLMSFKSLIQNWDGYGAIPTSARCAASAIRVMDGLSDQAIEKMDDFFPNTNGSVSLKWTNVLGEKISVSVGSNAFSYYCKRNGVEVALYDDVVINDDSISKLNDDILSVLIENV